MSQNVRKSQYVYDVWAYVLQLLRFVTTTMCAATFSNSYVRWRLRNVMLPLVAVPFLARYMYIYSCPRINRRIYSTDSHSYPTQSLPPPHPPPLPRFPVFHSFLLVSLWRFRTPDNLRRRWLRQNTSFRIIYGEAGGGMRRDRRPQKSATYPKVGVHVADVLVFNF